MINIVLYEPEIPPNTGNIIRLCANMGAKLHLIHPLGFNLDEKHLQRAGLDYHDLTSIKHYQNYQDFIDQTNYRLFACSTKGHSNYSQVSFKKNDALLFGPETRGLPAHVLNTLPQENIIRIPMLACSRSLNLSNAAAIIAYEAWRQIDFAQP